MGKLLAVVVAILVLAISVPLFYLDSIAQSALEEGGSETFGTRMTVGGFDFGLFTGEVGIDDLRVRNPEGWKAKYFFSIHDGDFAVGLREFLEDEVVVPKLVLSEVEVSLERRANSSNYDTILGHMQKGPPPPPDADAKRFVIRELLIRDVRADLRLEVPGGVGRDLEVLIPEIRLANVGSESSGGVVASQVWSTVMRAVLAAVVREGGGVAGFITRDLAGDLGRLGSVPFQVIGTVTRTGTEAALGVGGKATEVLGDAAGGLGEAAGGALKKGLGGLLDRKEE